MPKIPASVKKGLVISLAIMGAGLFPPPPRIMSVNKLILSKVPFSWNYFLSHIHV